jgi:hypothetical protein
VPPTILRDEYVVINGVTLCIAAFQAKGLSPLLDGPKWRGDFDRLPGIDGGYSFDDVEDVTDFVLGVVINGAWKWDDTAHTNPRQGLIDNTEYLKANLGIGLASVTMVWHRPNASTKTGPIKIRGPYGVTKDPAPSVTETSTFDVFLLDGHLSS